MPEIGRPVAGLEYAEKALVRGRVEAVPGRLLLVLLYSYSPRLSSLTAHLYILFRN